MSKKAVRAGRKRDAIRHPSEAVGRDYSAADDLHPMPSGRTVSHGPYFARSLSDDRRLDVPSRRCAVAESVDRRGAGSYSVRRGTTLGCGTVLADLSEKAALAAAAGAGLYV
jgi:hypothetical protein